MDDRMDWTDLDHGSMGMVNLDQPLLDQNHKASLSCATLLDDFETRPERVNEKLLSNTRPLVLELLTQFLGI